MKPKQGELTGQFGEWLTKYLDNKTKYHQHVVYYDHGDSQSNPNVVAIKGLYGEKLSRRNQLTQVDVVVVNPNRELALVVEIEERISSPKKIIGDIVANLMCNRYSVRLDGVNNYLSITPETKLYISGIVSLKGSKMAQLEDVISPRLQEFVTPQGGIDPKNIALLFREDIETAINALREEMIEFFS